MSFKLTLPRQLGIGLIIGLIIGVSIVHYQYQKGYFKGATSNFEERIIAAYKERINNPRPCLVCISDSENDGLISCNEMLLKEKNDIGRQSYESHL